MPDVTNLTKLFQNTTGDHLVMKPGQLEIFNTIVTRQHKRNVITCYTRYGKSLTVGLGALVRAILYPETWVIVAPSKEKTEIIMRYIIQHLFDNPFFFSQLEVDVALEKLKRERKKDSLTFRRGGRIYTLTAEARNQKRIGGALLGEGAGNVILDESPLIPDNIHAFILRMLGDSADNFLIEIGNTFGRNHFYRAFQDSRYNKVVIDCYRGLEESKLLPYHEGKLTEEFLEEMRDKPFFDQLYECKFPQADLIDEKGYTQLTSIEKINEAMARKVEKTGKARLGIDIGRGGDYTVFVARWDNYAKVLEKNRDPDLMSQIGRALKYKEDLGIDDPADIFVDDIGVGSGVSDRLWEKDVPCTKVVAGSPAQDSSKFSNTKAEMSWNAKVWLENKNNALEPNDDFKVMEEIRYKEDSDRKLKIEPKQDLRQRLGFSPDVPDAFFLTFARKRARPEIMML